MSETHGRERGREGERTDRKREKERASEQERQRERESERGIERGTTEVPTCASQSHGDVHIQLGTDRYAEKIITILALVLSPFLSLYMYIRINMR